MEQEYRDNKLQVHLAVSFGKAALFDFGLGKIHPL
jgi:hypothetical protein